MGFRFRKSVRLFPGVRLNLGKSGMSVSVGGPGAIVNFGPRHTALTLGIPGTGLSYRHQFPKQTAVPARQPTAQAAFPPAPPLSNQLPSDLRPPEPIPGEIRSGEVASLTSPDLTGLKRLINEAAAQREALKPELTEAIANRAKLWKKLRRREQPPLRFFMKSAIPQAKADFEEVDTEALKVAAAVAVSHINVDFTFDAESLAAQQKMESTYASLARAHRIWDVMSSVGIDRVRERSAASHAITRTPVRFTFVTDGIIAGGRRGLRFQNANGADLDIFPGILLMRARSATDYALIDLRELQLDYQPKRFIEEDPVPADAKVIGHAWEKSNKDGSPDRRFSDNRQIPIALYGELRFTTPSGVAEAYHVSNCEAAMAFGQAFHELQAALHRQAESPEQSTITPQHVTGIDGEQLLPALPQVGGAHEFTLLAGAAICAPLVAFALKASPTPPPVSLAPTAVAPTVAATAPVLPAAPSAPTSMPSLIRDRLTTAQAANLRSAPERSAATIRVMPAGTSVAVFDRRNGWVQVGDVQPSGWIHSSLLK